MFFYFFVFFLMMRCVRESTLFIMALMVLWLYVMRYEKFQFFTTMSKGGFGWRSCMCMNDPLFSLSPALPCYWDDRDDILQCGAMNSTDDLLK